MFDCAAPTRNGRNGQAFTSTGRVNIKNAEYVRDFGPLDPGLRLPRTCAGYSRAYLNFLFRAQELLVLRLLSLHNIYFLIKLLNIIRKSYRTPFVYQVKNGIFQQVYFFQKIMKTRPILILAVAAVLTSLCSAASKKAQNLEVIRAGLKDPSSEIRELSARALGTVGA